MASKDQGADKTEKPTPKRIRDARKEGNVSKSKDLTSTVLVLGWLVGGWVMMGFMWRKLRALFEASLQAIGQPFGDSLRELGHAAFDALLWLSLPLLALALFLGVLVEFLQVGPIATLKKALPSVDVGSKEAFDAAHERSDVCAVAAASIVGEAMVAITLADAVLEKFGGDSVKETRRNVESYLDTLRFR